MIERYRELRVAAGGRAEVIRKTRDLAVSVRNLLSRRERDQRYARLQAAGLTGERPTDWQMALGAYHMMVGFILPSNQEFYAAYGRGHWWSQVLRVVDEPSAMVDPIGLGIGKEMLISHLVQVVHTSAGYDVALLLMFEDGLTGLRAELRQLVEGTHPRQEGIDALIEREGYHAALLQALDRFEDDPEANWRVDTMDAPDGCEDRFEWGIEQFGTPGRLFAYSRTLPQTPGASLVAWWNGHLPIPSPA